MKETDYINAYAMALAQFNLNQIRQENEMLKTTAGMTVPIPAYKVNAPTYCGERSIFEPTGESEDDDYKRGFLDGWVKCTDYFIKHEQTKDDVE